MFSTVAIFVKNLFLLCLFCHLLMISINPFIFYLNERMVHYNRCQMINTIAITNQSNIYFRMIKNKKHLYMFPLLITTCETKPFDATTPNSKWHPQPNLIKYKNELIANINFTLISRLRFICLILQWHIINWHYPIAKTQKICS